MNRVMPTAPGPERREMPEDAWWPRDRRKGRVLLAVLMLAVAAVVLAVTAVDAAVAALLGTRPLTLWARISYLRARDHFWLARDHYRWASDADVIDAEVIEDPEGDVRR